MSLSNNKINLLLIDDQIETTENVKLTLYQENINILESDNYNAAIKQIQTHTINCIIINSNLMTNDAFHIINSIKNNPKTQEIPIIALTTKANLSEKNQLTLLKTDDFLNTTFSPNELLIRIKKHLNIIIHKILVISSTDNKNEMLTTLQNQGLHPIFTDHFPTAFQHLQKENFQCILCDTTTQQKDRQRFIEKILSSDHFSKIPILFLSFPGDLTLKEMQLCMKTFDFLSKPYAPIDLILKLKKLLSTTITTPKEENVFVSPSNLFSKDTFLPKDMIQKEKESLFKQLSVTLNHKIRSPLTSILIGAQALINLFPEGSEEQQLLTNIESSSKNIQEVLDSLENTKQFVTDDYVYGIKMLDLSKEKPKRTKRRS